MGNMREVSQGNDMLLFSGIDSIIGILQMKSDEYQSEEFSGAYLSLEALISKYGNSTLDEGYLWELIAYVRFINCGLLEANKKYNDVEVCRVYETLQGLEKYIKMSISRLYGELAN